MLEEKCKVCNIGASRKKDGFTRTKVFKAMLELLPLLSFTALENSQDGPASQVNNLSCNTTLRLQKNLEIPNVLQT